MLENVLSYWMNLYGDLMDILENWKRNFLLRGIESKLRQDEKKIWYRKKKRSGIESKKRGQDRRNEDRDKEKQFWIQ